MDKQIRRLTIDDYDALVRVWGLAGLSIRPNGRESREMIEKEMARDLCAFFGVFDGDKMVAVTIAQYDGRRGWINRLAVEPDYRGQGLALELVAECEKFLEQYGEVVIAALVEDVNSPSLALFEKAGYVCMNEIKYWSKRPRADL